jgi:hypothetical protein
VKESGPPTEAALFVRSDAEYRESEQLVKDQPAYEGGIEGHAAHPRIDLGGNAINSVTRSAKDAAATAKVLRPAKKLCLSGTRLQINYHTAIFKLERRPTDSAVPRRSGEPDARSERGALAFPESRI